ncbi:MAG: PKD domain-containing protein [Chloroflexi bacterium]|nr:PKD domain-containing protein [Chloroflexota bacterium]
MKTRFFKIISLTVMVTMLLAPFTVTAAPPVRDEPQPDEQVQSSCALLDDPAKRALMSGAFETNLLVDCGRADELGQVRSAGPASPFAPDDLGLDVLINDPTTDVGGTSFTQSETSLARNDDSSVICSAYNDAYHGVTVGDGFTGYSSSTDKGATWVDHGVVPTGGGGLSRGDPANVWSKRDGTFYHASLHSNGLGVWDLGPGCDNATWVAMLHTGSGDDKELMAVDNNPSSLYYGRLYVVWTNFDHGLEDFTYSDDGGVTWSTPIQISAGSGRQGAWPAVDPVNGDVYAAWLDRSSSTNHTIEIVRSTDGGATWSACTNPITGYVTPQDNTATSNCGRQALNGDVRYLDSPQIVIDQNQNIHVVYSYDPDGNGVGDVINVYYRRSTDQCASWETEIQLNDDGTMTDQWFPALAVNDHGVVGTFWYDRRLDVANNYMYDYYKSVSYDNGVTFEPNERVSDVSSAVVLDPNLATCYHGDYDTSIADTTRFYIQWSDDRGGTPDIWSDTELIMTEIGILTGVVSDSVMIAPIAGVDVQATLNVTYSFATSTDVSGTYSMMVMSGTYDVTAAKYGYQTGAVSGVSVISGTTTTLDIPLDPAVMYLVDGTVTDLATGDPLWATIDISGDPFDPPTTTLETDPATGYYSITLAEDVTYTFEASALLHVPTTTVLAPLTSDTTQDVSLDATTQEGMIAGWVLNYYTDNPIEGATVEVDGIVTPTTTNADGYFETVTMTAGFYTATASANLYSSVTISDVEVLTSNVALLTFRLATAQIVVDPMALTYTLELGQQITQTPGMTISNTGDGVLDFELQERNSRDFEPALVTKAPYPYQETAYWDETETAPAGAYFDAPMAWGTGASIPSGPRYRAAGTTCDGQTYYIFGGDDGTNTRLDEAWRYDPGSDTWTALASVPVALMSFEAACIDNYIYLVGGYNAAASHTNHFFIYDIAGDSWTATTWPNTRTPMTAVWDGKLYAFGGNPGPSNETWVYDPSGSSWTQLTSAPTANSYGAAVTVGDYIYQIGGGLANTVQRYDPAGDTWDNTGPQLQDSRMSALTVWYGDYVYVVSGGGSGGDYWTGWNSTEVYDVSQWPGGTWAYDDETVPTPAVGMAGDCAVDMIWGAGGVSGSTYDTNQYLDDGMSCNVGGLDVPWFSEAPITGTVVPAGAAYVDIGWHADVPEVDQPGTYYANLKIGNNDPLNQGLMVPVTMTVIPPPTWGKLDGTVTGLGYCDVDPAVLDGAEVLIQGSSGMSWTITTDPSGYYGPWWIDEAESPLTVTVSYQEHTTAVMTTTITAGVTTTEAFDLRWLVPCIDVTADVFSVTQDMGASTTLQVSVTNTGAAPLNYEFQEQDKGFQPTMLLAVPVPGYQSLESKASEVALTYAGQHLVSRDSWTYQLSKDIFRGIPANVLLLEAGGATQIQAMLQAYPDLDGVDTFDATVATPTLAQLLAYDTVVAIANSAFLDSVGIGDVLADYIDAGGTVVQTVPTFDSASSWGIRGRYFTDGYSPFISTGDWFLWANLGPFDPAHSIMQGVTAAGDSLRQVMTMDAGATWVADWTDDEFVATKGSVVALNTLIADGYSWTGDVDLIVHNSIIWLQSGGDVPWLSEDPITGTLPADTGFIAADVTLDANQVGLPGVYSATLTLSNDDPINDSYSYPVIMTVTLPVTYGVLEGTVTGLGYCDVDPNVLDGADVLIEGSSGTSWTLTTDASGYYGPWWFNEAESPMTVTVTYDNHEMAVAYPVTITAQATTTRDLNLRWLEPCVDVQSPPLEATLQVGVSTTLPVSITNTGAVSTGFSMADSALWLFEDPITGTLDADTGFQLVDVTLDAAYVTQPGVYYDAINVTTDDPVNGSIGRPVTMTVVPPPTWGLLEGTVTGLGYCDVNPAPLTGADVLIEGSSGTTWTLTTGISGTYGYWYDETESPMTVTVSYPEHITAVVTTTITAQTTTTRDLYLRWLAPCVDVTPPDLSAVLDMGMSTTLPLTVTNWGAEAFDLEIKEDDGGMAPLAPTAGEDVLVVEFDTSAATAMETALTNLGYTYLGVNRSTFEAMAMPDLLQYQAVFYAGSTSGDSWAQAMAYLDAGGSLYISDNDLGYFQNATVFYQTYLQATYVSDSGSDGVLTGMDIMAGVNPDVSPDPWPDDFTVGAEGVEIFVAPSANSAGVKVDRNGYLAIYTAFDFDDVASVTDEEAIIDRVMDYLGMVDVPWLSEDPITGTLAVDGGQVVVDVTLDTNFVAQPEMEYYATLNVRGNDPNGPFGIPVTMTVTAPPDWGKLEGTVTGLGYCDVDLAPLDGADILIEGSGGVSWTLTTDISGTYSYWFDEANSPMTVTVTYPDHGLGLSTDVMITGMVTTTQDFDLRWLEPCVDVQAPELSAVLDLGLSTTLPVTITNWGAAALDFTLTDTDDGRVALAPLADAVWLSEVPLIGTLAADGDYVVVDVTLDTISVTQPAMHYYAALNISSNDPVSGYIGLPVTMTVSSPADWGKLQGTVTSLGYCDVDPAPLDGVEVFVESSLGTTWTLTTDADGYYAWWMGDSESPITVTVAPLEHEMGVAYPVTITAQTTTTQDFDLRWLEPCVDVQAPTIEATLDMGMSTTLPLSVTNTGAVSLSFEFEERDGGYTPLRLTQSSVDLSLTGPETSQALEADSGQVTLSGQPVGTRGSIVALPDPWIVIPSMPAGVSRPTGAALDGKFYVIGGEESGGARNGYVQVYDPNTMTWENSAPTMPTGVSNFCAAVIGTDIYVPGGYDGTGIANLQVFHTSSNSWETITTDPLPASNFASACAVYDDKLYVFGGESVNASWVYDPSAPAGSRWDASLASPPVASGYGAALAVGDFIFYSGLGVTSNFADVYAYDPAGDTWITYPGLNTGRGGAGMWAIDDMLYIGGGGWSSYLTSVEEYDTSLGVAGVWSVTNSLVQGRRTFAWASSPETGRLYVGAGWSGAFLNEAEETAFPPILPDVPWLSEDPITGTLPADTGFVSVDVTMDTISVTQPGDYYATLILSSDDPINDKISHPVTMHVTSPANWGKLEGTVTGMGYCDANPVLMEGLDVFVESSLGTTWTLTTDPNGYYTVWMDESESPVTVTVAPPEYEVMTYSVAISAQTTATMDFDMRWMEPCIDVVPLSMEATVGLGDSEVQTLTLYNDGAVASDFDLSDLEPWLSEDPVTGTVSADSMVDVLVTFTALPTMTNGIYTATLKVNADDPFTSSYELPMTMTVVSSPTCGFISSSPDTVDETTVFTNTSTGSNPMVYRWNFGDSSGLSAAENPTHDYAQAGSYTAVLTAENSYGPSVCTGTVDIVLPTYALTVNTVGSGTVTLDPVGGVYDEGTVVTLTANADPGWYFIEWTGDLTGFSNPDTIVMDSDKVITATFDTTPLTFYTLTVATDGTGVGTVDPSVGTYSYLSGTVVPITATVGLNSTFDGWSGGLSGSVNPTSITMDGHKSVTATFNLIPGVYYTLTIATDGTGVGTVDPSVGAHSYLSGTVVPITATVGLNSTFDGWNGNLSGLTNPTSITMDGHKSVTATFDLIPGVYYTLTVATDGTGVGTVDPSVGAHSYLSGTVVPITATANVGSVFSGWSGNLTGMVNPTSLLIDATKVVTATFDLTGYEIYLPLVVRNS